MAPIVWRRRLWAGANVWTDNTSHASFGGSSIWGQVILAREDGVRMVLAHFIMTKISLRLCILRLAAMSWQEANIGTHSFAWGHNAQASGTASTALGYNVQVSGDNSTAMGRSTTASGFYSTAMGSDTTASGTSSTAMGSNTTRRWRPKHRMRTTAYGFVAQDGAPCACRIM